MFGRGRGLAAAKQGLCSQLTGFRGAAHGKSKQPATLAVGIKGQLSA
jgi:hypothetical protein